MLCHVLGYLCIQVIITMFGLGLLVLSVYNSNYILEHEVVHLTNRKEISIETKYDIDNTVSEGILK